MREGQFSSISQKGTPEEIGEFWDAHSPEDFDIEERLIDIELDPLARITSVNIAPEILDRVRRIAQEQQVTTQTLVNLWLAQHLADMER